MLPFCILYYESTFKGIKMELREKQLLELVRSDYHQGIARVIDEYGGAVKSICSHILRNCDGSLIDDAVQETFVSLWQCLSQGTIPSTSLKAYLYQIARNQALSELKKYQKQKGISLEQLQYTGIEELVCNSGDDLEHQVDLDWEYEKVHKVIEETDEPDRTIFLLRYFYNYTVREISVKVKLKEDNVESRIRRCRVKLRKKLMERGVFYES